MTHASRATKRQDATLARAHTPVRPWRAALLAATLGSACCLLGACGKEAPPGPAPGGSGSARAAASGSASAATSAGPAGSTAASGAAAATSTAAPGAPAAGVGVACTLGGVRNPLVVGKLGDAPISTWSSPDEGRAAAGFPSDTNKAVGFTLDLGITVSKASFSDDRSHRVLRVVPYPARDGFSFAVDDDNPKAVPANPVSVGGDKLIRFGVFKKAVVASVGESTATSVVWLLPSADPVAGMQAAGCGKQGAAVALRIGEALWSGWVDAAGKPVGALEKIPEGLPATGAVLVGCNGTESLLAYDTKSGKAEAVALARTPWGKAPTQPALWQPPAGGPEGPAVPTSVAWAADGRVLLSWLQGKPGGRELRFQTYDAKLAPIGDPVVVVGKGTDALGGAVVIGKGGGVVLIRTRDGAYDRVAYQGLSCP